MGQAEPVKKHYTFEEYIEIENVSEERHEYYYGEIFNMAGTTLRHFDIHHNLITYIRKQLKGKKCKVYGETIKTEIVKKFHYVYPDVVVSCHDAENDLHYIKYPQLIIEILSDSTELYDRTDKFNAYRQIPTLEHYVLVSQKKCMVECYTRQEGEWKYKVYESITDFLELSTLDIKLPLAEIYENIEFDVELKIVE